MEPSLVIARAPAEQRRLGRCLAEPSQLRETDTRLQPGAEVQDAGCRDAIRARRYYHEAARSKTARGQLATVHGLLHRLAAGDVQLQLLHEAVDRFLGHPRQPPYQQATG